MSVCDEHTLIAANLPEIKENQLAYSQMCIMH